MSFGLIYTPGKWGSWGVLENRNQATSPRYAALANWGALNNPPKTPGAATATVQSTGSEQSLSASPKKTSGLSVSRRPKTRAKAIRCFSQST